MKNQLKFALTAAALVAAPFASAAAEDCAKLAQSVKTAVSADTSRVLEIVASTVARDHSCACEVVKSAIVASNASEALVAQIVETAVLEAPSELRLIAQCAIATAPEATASIQGVIEKYDAAGGEGYSAKGGMSDAEGGMDPKGGLAEPDPVAMGNPLDYPFQSINDPIIKGGDSSAPFLPPFFFSPPEDDPNVTAPLASSGSPGLVSGGEGTASFGD